MELELVCEEYAYGERAGRAGIEIIRPAGMSDADWAVLVAEVIAAAKEVLGDWEATPEGS